MPPILVYEENRTYVIDRFHNGHFDYVDMVLEAPQRDFFRFVASSLLLERLAQSYPTPRKKEEVPGWPTSPRRASRWSSIRSSSRR